ncbi:hypothetical protein ABL78_5521 [Leptomonas seymouri]|uniref:Uncharacterized protein n=1 Tax=Leptomonas seymouri TaxID=5684 RepID=A0A0N1I3F2_LEPSE|nr:hypothetical protein ABL78_5521 [Leptomonas seymouri]|eukprot:KPI85431.1 hypothetical protein ABL78_5521 [Leptomonas seymouri]
MATIVIGRKELFSFAERYSSRRLTDYSSLADGEVLCCLFNLVFHDRRIRPAAPQTHSATQRGHINWELLFRRFAQLGIPPDFLQPQALRQNTATCGFSTLVLFYFLHHLSKRADFVAEFALDVSESVTTYLQSTDCIASLLLGNALSWSAIPEALQRPLQDHPIFQRSAEAAAAAEDAAVELYRSSCMRRHRAGRHRTNSSASSLRSSGHQSHRSTCTAPAEATNRSADEVTDKGERRSERMQSPQPQRAQSTLQQAAGSEATAAPSSPAVAQRLPHGRLVAPSSAPAKQSHRPSSSSFHGVGGRGELVSGSESDESPLPRDPSRKPSARAAPLRQPQPKPQPQPQPHPSTCSASSSDRSRNTDALSAASSSFSSTSRADSGTGSSLEGSDVWANGAARSSASRRLLRSKKSGEREHARRPPSCTLASASSSVSRASSASIDTVGCTLTDDHAASAQTSQHAQGHSDPQQQLPPPNHQHALHTAETSSGSSRSSARVTYRTAPSVVRHNSTQSQNGETPPEPALHESSLPFRVHDTSLEAARYRNDEECEALRMRVAQLLSLLANLRATSMAASLPNSQRDSSAQTSPLASPRSRTLQEYEQRIEALEAQLRAYEGNASARASPELTPAALEAEISALTADVVDEETGAPINVSEQANLLHCLLLEHLQGSPHNREQMQQWLWSIVAAHHTLEGRLLAAAELLRRASKNESRFTAWAGASSSRSPVQSSRLSVTSPLTASHPRSQSTVAAPFAAADTTPWRRSPLREGPPHEEAPANAGELQRVRSAFYAELERLHRQEHELRDSLAASRVKCAATVRRAVHRERLWKQLCGEVYAAEQASFHITECDTADDVEAHLQQRDVHYQNVEALTQQLVEDSEVVEGGSGIRHTTPSASEKASAPCSSLQTLVTHLKEEREELLADVTRLHDWVTAMQQERTEATQKSSNARGESSSSAKVTEKRGTQTTTSSCAPQLPIPPGFPLDFYRAAAATDATRRTNETSAVPRGRPSNPRAAELHSGAARLPHGLSSLLKEDAATYPVV